ETTIGGTATAARSAIPGNGGSGIAIVGNHGEQIQSNYIGTNASGTAAIGNVGQGIGLSSASNISIGGTAAGAGNLISGNQSEGIRLSDASTNNTVQGNFIGTNAAGTAGIANAIAGIAITGSGAAVNTDNTIGGTAAGAGNHIAFNAGTGISFPELAEANVRNAI